MIKKLFEKAVKVKMTAMGGKKEILADIKAERDKKTAEYKLRNQETPKGYVRVRNMLNPDHIAIFRLASAKGKLETEEVGTVYIIPQKGYWYVVVPDLGAYAIGAEVDANPMDQFKEAVKNMIPTIIKSSKEATAKPLPYSKIIGKDTVSKIKKFIKFFGATERELDTTYISIKNGELKITDADRTLITKEKLDIPDINGMKAYDLKSVTGEIYINDNGEFRDTDGGIKTTYDIAGKALELSNADLTIKITQSMLKSLLTTQKASDKNNPKFELNGILIDAENGEAKAVGTNTRRLTISKPFKVTGKDGQYIIQKNVVDKDIEIIKIGEASDGKSVTYTETKDYKHTAHRIVGRFPDYQRVVPMYPKPSVKINTKELEAILRKADEVRFAFSDNNINVSTYHVEGEDTMHPTVKTINIGKIETKSNMGNKSIGFASKYVLDAIGDSKEITFEMDEPTLPFIITAEDGTKTVIMPITMPSEDEIRDDMERKVKREQERERERELAKAKEIEAELARKEEEKEEEGIAHHYLNTLTPMRRGRAKKVLSNLIGYDGEVMEKKDFIEKLCNEGYKPEYSEWKEYNSKLGRNVDKSEWSMVQYDASTGSVSNAYAVTKTEAELAQFLLNGTTVFDSIENSVLLPDKKITIGGIAITIESERGTFRNGIDDNGTEWESELQDDYGYFDGTHGADGDEVDVFLSHEATVKQMEQRPVFYIKQLRNNGTFDEDKFILGAKNKQEAEKIYHRNYQDGYSNDGEWYKIDFAQLSRKLDRLSTAHIGKTA